MRFFLLSAVGLIAAGAGYQSFTSAPPLQGTQPSPAVSIAAEAKARYRLLVPGNASDCTVTKGPDLADGLAEIEFSAGCGALYPRLARVRYWREDGNGEVSFARADGKAVIRFAAGDGIAYESYRPTTPFISLVANQR